MIRILLPLAILVIAHLNVHGQPFTDPKSGSTRSVFRSKNDSITLAELEQRFLSIKPDPTNRTGTDSLVQQLLQARAQAIVGTKTLYQSRYPLLSEARKMPVDSVKALSLVGGSLPKDLATFRNLEVIELMNTPVRKLAALRKVKHLKTLYLLNPTASKPLRISKKLGVENLLIQGANPAFVPAQFANPHLQRLHLAQNGLVRMPDVSKASRLEVLVLRNNRIEKLESYRGNSHLKELELQVNQLKEVPAAVANFSGLKKLVFSGNQISEVSPALGTLKNLEQLAFYRNRLAAIPPSLYELSSLRVLDLYYNQIKRIDDSMARWNNMEVLYLSHNQLINLPEAVGQLTQLKELYVHNNLLSVLPGNLAQLTNLTVLRINNNLLSALPDKFESLQLLDYLDVSHNQFTYLPLFIGHYPNLELLTLSGNPLERDNRDQWQPLATQLRNQGVVVNLESDNTKSSDPSQ
jgi:Leucine-rich repeat (LRR) protein